jgi:hypothetical protein
LARDLDEEVEDRQGAWRVVVCARRLGRVDKPTAPKLKEANG